MQQQYYITVPWNLRLRNVSTDADGLATLVQLTDGALPTESNRYQMGCILSVLDGEFTGLYSNSGTVQNPTWTSIIISPVIRISKIITSQEILSLFTTPVDLAPAPGVGKYIIAQQVFLRYQNGGVSYTQPGNTNIVMGANNVFQFGNFLGGASTIRQQPPIGVVVLTENTGLQVVNTIGNPTNGNGQFEIIIYYQIATSTL